MSNFSFSPLHPKFAARVTGVQIDQEINQGAFAEIQQAFDQLGVLVFPNQQINAEQQQAFAQRFGDLETFPEQSMQKSSPKVYNVSNVDRDGKLLGKNSIQARMLKGTELWHTDSSYRAIPALASFLLALEIPDHTELGGQTEFADMIAALEEMPETLRSKINGRSMVHNYEYERLYVDTDLPPIPLTEKLLIPPVTHPLIRTHSHIDKNSLYITANVGDTIGGYSYEEGRTLHSEVLAFATQKQFIYRHEWSVGDLVVWDNRRSLHRVIPYDLEKNPRIMQRTTVTDTAPPRPAWIK